jgi:hypothetical protein
MAVHSTLCSVHAAKTTICPAASLPPCEQNATHIFRTCALHQKHRAGQVGHGPGYAQARVKRSTPHYLPTQHRDFDKSSLCLGQNSSDAAHWPSNQVSILTIAAGIEDNPRYSCISRSTTPLVPAAWLHALVASPDGYRMGTGPSKSANLIKPSNPKRANLLPPPPHSASGSNYLPHSSKTRTVGGQNSDLHSIYYYRIRVFDMCKTNRLQWSLFQE